MCALNYLLINEFTFVDYPPSSVFELGGNKVLTSQLEVGRLYLERGDVLKSLEILAPVAEQYLVSQQYDRYLDTLQLIFRAHAELLDFDFVDRAELSLNQLAREHAITLTPKMLYTLGLCASYRSLHKESLEYCKQALTLSIKCDDQEGMSHAILGMAISYYNLDQLQESLKEIYNLQIVMNILDLPQVRISSQILKGQILRKLKKYDQALDILWQSYEMLKTEKNLYSYISLLYGISLTYKESGHIEEARNYLRLATKTIDSENLKRLASLVEKLSIELGAESAVGEFDLIFNLATNSIIERNLGKVDLQNQFILIDLLKMFMTQPGVSFTKEQVVKFIWKQSYNPSVHDNKIYVTIKRLRQILEPNIEKPKYIFRSKYGYYFSKDVRIRIEQSSESVRGNL